MFACACGSEENAAETIWSALGEEFERQGANIEYGYFRGYRLVKGRKFFLFKDSETLHEAKRILNSGTKDIENLPDHLKPIAEDDFVNWVIKGELSDISPYFQVKTIGEPPKRLDRGCTIL